MERYDNLDLDLECEGGGGVAQKTLLFGGMFKKSTKSTEPSPHSQGSLAVNSELSKSNDSLTDNTKEKGGVFKGMFKKTTKTTKELQPQDNLSLQNPDLSASSDSLTDNKSTKEKPGMLGGILKRSPKPGHVRRPSQDLLVDDFTSSNGSLNENPSTKETGGMFKGILKKTPNPFARTQSQDDLSAPGELSGTTDNTSLSTNTKEGGGGVFSGMFKKSPKPSASKTRSQDDLSAPSELSASTDNLSENNNNTKEKGGIFGGVFKKRHDKSHSRDDLSMEGDLSGSRDSLTDKPSKGEAGSKLWNPFSSSSQEKAKTGHSAESKENPSTEKPKTKQNGFSELMRSTFYSDKPGKNSDSDSEEILDSGEGQTTQKQGKFAEAMTKLNPFRAANKKEDSEDTDKQVEEKPEGAKSNMVPRERNTPALPPRPTEEEMKRTSSYSKAKLRGPEENQGRSEDGGLTKDTQSVAKEGDDTKVEIKTTTVKKHKHIPFKPRAAAKAASDDEGLKEEEILVTTEAGKDEEEDKDKAEEVKVKKPKRHNPFMPRVKASSDDEGLKEEDDSSSKEEKKDEEESDKTEEKKKVVKKPKKHNPFMPRVKGKGLQRKTQDDADGNSAENQGGNRSLFDQLEDFRIEPPSSENAEDVNNLMDWWENVESWEDTPQDEDMTEKEEAKAFAVTAEKVQKGIRVFNKLFSERAESLWQHVIDLNFIADGLDKFSKNTKIAQITGGSTSAIGGVATIAGLALAPVTMGTSLIVTAVGLGVAAAGGLTSAGAGISNQVNNSMDRKKVERIVQDYQEKMVDLNKCLKFIKQGIENLKKFDLIKMKNHAYNRDFPVLSTSFYEDGAMAGKAILINANEIMRVVQIANVAGSTAARAVQIASMATGVLTGLFVGMDIYFVAKDSKELKKGAKSEFAAKIREVATQLHDGLVELNSIREELQNTRSDKEEEGGAVAAADNHDKEKKEKDNKYDSSDEDEIDRIKKAIKKDIENREYV